MQRPAVFPGCKNMEKQKYSNAVSPVLLNLQPELHFTFRNGVLRSEAGCTGKPDEIKAAYQALLDYARVVIKESREPDFTGWAIPTLRVLCLNQIIIVPFNFRVEKNQIILPSEADISLLIGRRLRQLFN